MKVYSVVQSVPYEGLDFFGVFASREDAVNFVKSVRNKYSDFGVVESELGQVVDVDGMVEWL